MRNQSVVPVMLVQTSEASVANRAFAAALTHPGFSFWVGGFGHGSLFDQPLLTVHRLGRGPLSLGIAPVVVHNSELREERGVGPAVGGAWLDNSRLIHQVCRWKQWCVPWILKPAQPEGIIST